MTCTPSDIERPETVTGITAHYLTGSRRVRRTRTFPDVRSYHRWERRAERAGHDIDCLDIDRGPEGA